MSKEVGINRNQKNDYASFKIINPVGTVKELQEVIRWIRWNDSLQNEFGTLKTQ